MTVTIRHIGMHVPYHARPRLRFRVHAKPRRRRVAERRASPTDTRRLEPMVNPTRTSSIATGALLVAATPAALGAAALDPTLSGRNRRRHRVVPPPGATPRGTVHPQPTCLLRAGRAHRFTRRPVGNDRALYVVGLPVRYLSQQGSVGHVLVRAHSQNSGCTSLKKAVFARV